MVVHGEDVPGPPVWHKPLIGHAYGRSYSVGNPIGLPPEPPPRRRMGKTDVVVLIASTVLNGISPLLGMRWYGRDGQVDVRVPHIDGGDCY